MSPEYANDGTISMKSDVFSLGVLLVEIVSGKMNRGFRHPGHRHNLIGHVSRKNECCFLLQTELTLLSI